MFLYKSGVSSPMRTYVIASLILAAFLITACGGTITGQAVAVDEPAPSEEASDDTSDDTADEPSDEDEHIIVEGLTEEEEKFAEEYEGKNCEEDSLGVVRVYEDGKKFVYKNDCLANILVDYGCEKGKLSTEIKSCPGKCEKDRYYVAYCA